VSGPALDAACRAAIAEGVLPAGVQPSLHGVERPWPVVLLTGLGAWLAAIPLIVVLGLLFGDLFRHGAGFYVVGLVLLGAAVALLRARAMPLFVEQIAVPALLTGAALLGVALYRDLPVSLASITLAGLAVVVALMIVQPWLRALLGAAGALLLAVAFVPTGSRAMEERGFQVFWLAWHANLVLWVLAGALQRAVFDDGAGASSAAALESLRAGWLLGTLAGLAWWTGMTFLVDGAVGGGFFSELARDFALRPAARVQVDLLRLASVLLGLAAAAWAGSQWSAFRRPWFGLVALILVALAWLMPALGAVLLALAITVTSSRWRLATAATFAAAWIVGAFYYQLDWSLTAKSAAMLGAGALMGICAWLARGQRGASGPKPAKPAATRISLAAALPIGASALAVLATVNVGAWQKERLIAVGEPLFVELAPVDPRSLAQGDYMRLNFQLPFDPQERTGGLLSAARPRVVARRDERGVARLLRIDDGAPLAPDEIRIELTPKGGRWTLVSDAWYFKEGEASRWAGARYGEFRVDSSGRALLVGLRGEHLEPL
jgi:uncharacterized membrane-anchored protein